MVKSGEVYVVERSQVDWPYCMDSSRPRNIMVPAGTGFTLRAAVQHQLWDLVRARFEGFI